MICNYSEPEDELILGAFENCKDDLHIPQNLAISSSGNNKSNKRKKVEKASNNDRYIPDFSVNDIIVIDDRFISCYPVIIVS